MKHLMSDTLRASLLGLVLAALTLAITSPAFAGPPTDFVKNKSAKLVEIINQPVGDARTKAMQGEVRTLVNYDELAKRALGEHWAKRSEAERKEFISLLERLVELNYANRFKEKRSGQDYKVNYTDEKERAETGQAIVKTEISYGKDVFTIDYKLVNVSQAYTIYDIVFDEVSLEETYREAYVPIIAKEGWASLLKRMKDKLTELERG